MIEEGQEPIDNEFDFVMNSIDLLAETLTKADLGQSQKLGRPK